MNVLQSIWRFFFPAKPNNFLCPFCGVASEPMQTDAMKCPKCGFIISKKHAASAMGESRSDAKVAASRENGKLGGRPRTKKPQT